MSPAPRLIDVAARRAAVAPGVPARIACAIAGGGEDASVDLVVRAVDLTRVAAEARRALRVPSEGMVAEVDLDIPAGVAGYALQAELVAAGTVVSEATGALLALRHWADAPRMGFLSAFGPGAAHPERIARLARYHLTVLQFYDWMYRHYRLLPPQDEFEDGMGRAGSLRTVRERVAVVHEHGMAALAYGAVYGAEREYAEAHPDELLRDARGVPHALIDRFFITDPRPGPWRERLLDEYEAAIRSLGFDAVHMDQYGSPKHAFDAAGSPVDLGAAFPGLIDAAAARVAAARTGATVTFNAVNDWPVEAVAGSSQAVVYLEVWAPHDRYRHLVDLVRRARASSGGKQVVLAAYLRPFRDGGAEAEAAAYLATAVIASAGGHHLLLGEGDAVLREPYYPDHGQLSDGGRRRMQGLYDHTAALHAYLFDPRAVERSRSYANGENPELALHGAAAASEPAAGAVWLAVAERVDGSLVINLVDLLGAGDDLWNAPKPVTATPLAGLTLELGASFRAPRVVWRDPRVGVAVELTPTPNEGAGTRFALPELDLWATLVVTRG